MQKYLIFLFILITNSFGCVVCSTYSSAIDVGYKINFNEKNLSNIDVTWKFSPMLSQAIIADFDEDRDNKLSSPNEIKEVKRTVDALVPVNFFTFINVDEKDVKLVKISNFKIKVKLGVVEYKFRFDINKPINNKSKITIMCFDEMQDVKFNIIPTKIKIPNDNTPFKIKHDFTPKIDTEIDLVTNVLNIYIKK